MPLARAALVALVVLGASCGREGSADAVEAHGVPGEGDGFPALPPTLHLEGSASGTSGNERATCGFFAELGEVVRVDGEGDEGGFDAVIVGGEVFRRLEPVAGEGFGVDFSALLGGAVTLRRTPAGDALRFVGDQSGAASRFWRALEVLVAPPAATTPEWAGTWSCAPLDVDDGPGFMDTSTIVEGAWTLAPP